MMAHRHIQDEYRDIKKVVFGSNQVRFVANKLLVTIVNTVNSLVTNEMLFTEHAFTFVIVSELRFLDQEQQTKILISNV